MKKTNGRSVRGGRQTTIRIAKPNKRAGITARHEEPEPADIVSELLSKAVLYEKLSFDLELPARDRLKAEALAHNLRSAARQLADFLAEEAKPTIVDRALMAAHRLGIPVCDAFLRPDALEAMERLAGLMDKA
jgi:hypothetical protein